MTSTGTLVVVLEEGVKLKEVEWLGKQDPYVILRCGEHEKQSAVCINGGRNPSWKNKATNKGPMFRFPNVTPASVLEMQIFDKNILWRNVLIGSCKLSLEQLQVFNKQSGKDKVLPVIDNSGNTHGCLKFAAYIALQIEVPAATAATPPPPPTPETEYTAPERPKWIYHETDDIRKHYDFGELLGYGGYGKLHIVRQKETGAEFACKTMSKRLLKRWTQVEEMKREILALYHLKGDKDEVVQIHEVFESPLELHIVVEYCRGGDLDHYLSTLSARGHRYSEQDVANLIRSILKSVQLCHKKRVAHRDIKPQNILLTSWDIEEMTVKLADFGLCEFSRHDQTFSDLVGTSLYIAPEVLKGSYGKEADIFSCGVLLHYLLVGDFPFGGHGAKALVEGGQMFTKMQATQELDLEEGPWQSVSAEAKACVRKMLQISPDQRPSAKELLEKDPWLREGGASSEQMDTSIVKRISGFAAANTLIRKVLLLLADDYLIKRPTGALNLKQTFDRLDANKDGKVTAEELQQALAEVGEELPHDELAALIEAADQNKDGGIDCQEFILATMEVSKVVQEEVMMESFKKIDVDGNGVITKEELESFLQQQSGSPVNVDALLAEVDTDNSGSIDFNEFAAVIRGTLEHSTSESCKLLRNLAISTSIQLTSLSSSRSMLSSSRSIPVETPPAMETATRCTSPPQPLDMSHVRLLTSPFASALSVSAATYAAEAQAHAASVLAEVITSPSNGSMSVSMSLSMPRKEAEQSQQAPSTTPSRLGTSGEDGHDVSRNLTHLPTAPDGDMHRYVEGAKADQAGLAPDGFLQLLQHELDRGCRPVISWRPNQPGDAPGDDISNFLRENDYSMIQDGDLYKFMPGDASASGALSLKEDGSTHPRGVAEATINAGDSVEDGLPPDAFMQLLRHELDRGCLPVISWRPNQPGETPGDDIFNYLEGKGYIMTRDGDSYRFLPGAAAQSAEPGEAHLDSRSIDGIGAAEETASARGDGEARLAPNEFMQLLQHELSRGCRPVMSWRPNKPGEAPSDDIFNFLSENNYSMIRDGDLYKFMPGDASASGLHKEDTQRPDPPAADGAAGTSSLNEDGPTFVRGVAGEAVNAHDGVEAGLAPDGFMQLLQHELDRGCRPVITWQPNHPDEAAGDDIFYFLGEKGYTMTRDGDSYKFLPGGPAQSAAPGVLSVKEDAPTHASGVAEGTINMVDSAEAGLPPDTVMQLLQHELDTNCQPVITWRPNQPGEAPGIINYTAEQGYTDMLDGDSSTGSPAHPTDSGESHHRDSLAEADAPPSMDSERQESVKQHTSDTVVHRKITGVRVLSNPFQWTDYLGDAWQWFNGLHSYNPFTARPYQCSYDLGVLCTGSGVKVTVNEVNWASTSPDNASSEESAALEGKLCIMSLAQNSEQLRRMNSYDANDPFGVAFELQCAKSTALDTLSQSFVNPAERILLTPKLLRGDISRWGGFVGVKRNPELFQSNATLANIGTGQLRTLVFRDHPTVFEFSLPQNDLPVSTLVLSLTTNLLVSKSFQCVTNRSTWSAEACVELKDQWSHEITVGPTPPPASET